MCFVRHADDVDVIGQIGVRFDAIEELKDGFKAKPPFPVPKKLMTYTLGGEFGNMVGEGQRRWTIADDQDVATAASGIMEKLKTLGLPYFERFSSLEKILDVLSGDDKAAWQHCCLHGDRAMSAIAAAYLLSRKEECLDLIQRKTLYLESRNDPDLPYFLEMARALKSRLGEN